MITQLTKPYSDKEIVQSLSPTVSKWFLSQFKTFSPPQKYSIVNMKKHRNTLISSPTGTGKTMSAFLTIIDDLIVQSKNENLDNGIYCLYISPLKALGNDIEKKSSISS